MSQLPSVALSSGGQLSPRTCIRLQAELALKPHDESLRTLPNIDIWGVSVNEKNQPVICLYANRPPEEFTAEDLKKIPEQIAGYRVCIIPPYPLA